MFKLLLITEHLWSGGFEDAVLLFDDPQHLSQQERIENGEYRWQTIGLVYGIVVILVAH
ncbi:hypothetical protein GJ611_09985, partial [Escherichia coli]|uniref:BrnT family toxin n=1 Tax=Escherichia coli TaxID=562 RepID=UPI0016B34190|nr:hypothetical protein [Escherichia coli]